MIAGDGPDRMAYERFMKLLGIEDRVFFFGPANRMQAVNLFKHCEFFVMPSRVEPFGIVNLEAMAAEKAVVAARTGGIPEVIDDGITGILVESCNDKALVKGIRQLLEDKQLRERLASNGRRKIEQADFSWNVIADKYLHIFKKFIDYGARLP